MPKPPKIGVVLLNWNTPDLTIDCLHSLARSTVTPWKILVVDNASRGDDADQIEAAFPDVHLIRNAENTGFVGGNNQGIEVLLNAGADAIWVLNNDTEVAPDCLEHLLACLGGDDGAEGVGVATHRMLYDDPPDRLWFAGGRISWSFSSSHEGFNKTEGVFHDPERDIDFATACSILVRRRVFEQIGGFHPAFFAFAEDLEWCVRLRKAGIRIRYTPAARLWHKVSSSYKKNTLTSGGTVSAFSHYVSARNRWFVLRLHAPGWRGILPRLRYFAMHAYLLLGLTIRRRKEKIRMLIKGFREGWTTEL